MMVFASSRVFSNTDLAAESEWSPTVEFRYPGLRSNDGVFSDNDVMRDLDQIVEFRTAPDDRGFSELRSTGVRADPDIILDDHAAYLRKFDVATPIFTSRTVTPITAP